MFPNGVIIFIIILVFDILSKSISDKKKIDKARNKAHNRPNRNIVIEKRPYEKVRKDIITNAKKEDSVSSVSNSANTELLTNEANINPLGNQLKKDNMSYAKNEVKDSVIENIKIKENKENLNRKKNFMKNDILKGIIYSEILSEPKSIKNIKRSI